MYHCTTDPISSATGTSLLSLNEEYENHAIRKVISKKRLRNCDFAHCFYFCFFPLGKQEVNYNSPRLHFGWIHLQQARANFLLFFWLKIKRKFLDADAANESTL